MKKKKNKIIGNLIKAGILLFIVYASCTGAYINGGLYSDAEIQLYGFISFAIVTFCCMIAPLIWRLINKQQFTCEKGKKICRWNSIIVLIISIIIYVFTDVNLVGWIYAIIYYFINKWIFVDETKPDQNENSKKIYTRSKITNSKDLNQIQENEVANITESIKNDNLTVKGKIKYCKYCGGKLNNDKKCTKCGKQYFRITKEFKTYSIIGILSIALVIFIILYFVELNNGIDVNKYQTLEKENSNLKKQLDKLTDGYTYDYTKNKLDFFNEDIVFVIEGNGNKYYTYDYADKCTPGSGIISYEDYIAGNYHPLKQDKYSYKVYHREEAIRLGYTEGTC